jgi:Taurine catabolism dioxygenase TauD, TfdA family
VTLATTKLTPHVGAEITGLSGRQLVDQGVAAEVEAALDHYGVVVIRDADVDDEDLVAFSRQLGDLVIAPTGEHELREIQTITLDPGRTNPVLAGFRRGNFFWHVDGVHDAVPQKSTFLSAREVAEEGGDTEFASTYAAYDALSEDEKARLDGLRVVHSFAAAQARANPLATEAERAVWERVPTREHPLVWTHRDVVRPLGFEPRTCGLRVRFRLSQRCPQVSDVLFCLRFRLPSLMCLRGSGELRGDGTRYANACNREHRGIMGLNVALSTVSLEHLGSAALRRPRRQPSHP